jgi:hypothetical protein
MHRSKIVLHYTQVYLSPFNRYIASYLIWYNDEIYWSNGGWRLTCTDARLILLVRRRISICWQCQKIVFIVSENKSSLVILLSSLYHNYSLYESFISNYCAHTHTNMRNYCMHLENHVRVCSFHSNLDIFSLNNNDIGSTLCILGWDNNHINGPHNI